MAYFAMLSGQGWTAIAGCRQFFYARYADWVVTTTLIVVLLGQVANAGNDVIFGACGANGEIRIFLSKTLPFQVGNLVRGFLQDLCLTSQVSRAQRKLSIADN